MRLAFMGTPVFAVMALDALHRAGHDIAAVYTQPPRPANRGQALVKSPVHQRAEALGLDVRMPAKLKDPADQADFAALKLDVAVVAAYGLILPQPILDAPTRGCLNIHASLLPRWRGAAPIQRAIEAGDNQSGISIMQMDAGLDTGAVLLAVPTPIAPDETAGSLHDRLALMGGGAIVDALARLDQLVPVAQPSDGIAYATKISKAEARLDWHQPAAVLARRIRAFNPAPGAYFETGSERIRILLATASEGSGPPGVVLDDQLAIACGTGVLRPTLVQRAGRGAMSPAEWLRGFALPAGTRLQ